MNRLMERIADVAGEVLAGPQSQSRVAAAEARLNVRFPASYRQFLLKFGSGIIGSSEIYGITRDLEDSGIPSVVWATLRARRDLGLPDAAVLVGYDGGEGYYVLDLSRAGPTGDVPVVRWWFLTQPLESAPIQAATFHDYLAQVIAESEPGSS